MKIDVSSNSFPLAWAFVVVQGNAILYFVMYFAKFCVVQFSAGIGLCRGSG
jgi:hypothetical protein